MLRWIQYSLLVIYAALPIGMLGWAAYRRCRGRIAPLVSFIFTCFLGFAIGVALAVIDSKLMGGRVPLSEAARLMYLSIAAIIFLRLIDWLIGRGLFLILRVQVGKSGRMDKPRWRGTLALLLQKAMLFTILVPYIFALLLAYRPKMTYGFTPQQLKLAYSDVSFDSSDGLRLAGWWIPAVEMPASAESPDADPKIAAQWGRQTAILCHGMGAGKEHGLGLAWLLASRGFNVLVFDFRGHGQSGGSYVSYGDRERYDVLAAVRWVKSHHAEGAEKVFGIGMNTGAAALIAAAADDGDGQAIDALVLFEPYARFGEMARTHADQILPRGINWLVRNVGVPIAGAHAGVNLSSFAPVDCADRLWPRPVLVIHGRGLTFIPTPQEMELYRWLPQPKNEFWPPDNYEGSRSRRVRLHGKNGKTHVYVHLFQQWMGTYQSVWGSAAVQMHMLRFMRDAEANPVI